MSQSSRTAVREHSTGHAFPGPGGDVDGVSVERYLRGDESVASMAYGNRPDETRYQFHTAADEEAVAEQFGAVLGAPSETVQEAENTHLSYDDQHPVNEIAIGAGDGMTRVAVYADAFSGDAFETVRDEAYAAAQREV